MTVTHGGRLTCPKSHNKWLREHGFRPRSTDFKHLFLSLLTICISSLEKCLFRSSALFFFFFLIVYFLILSCLSCLHILEINPLLVKSFTNIFPHSVGCLFAMVVCAVQKLLCLIRSYLFIFVFVSIALGERSKEKKIAVIFVKECPAYAFL